MSVIRPDLAEAQPYRWQEGLPTDRPLHRFDMNTQPLPPAWYARAQARLSRVLVQSYPDATYSRLRALLSEFTGHPAHLIIPTSGADEALYVCAQLTLRPGDRAFARRPRYSVYDMAVRLAGGTIADQPDGAKLRFVCSPHNPTGADGSQDELAQFGGLLAIDQAYVEFGGVDHSPLVLQRDDTVVIRSMSKAFALAGARVGYMLAPEALAAQIDAIRLPAGISSTSAALAEMALENLDEMRATAAATVAERDRMAAALTAAGIGVRPSCTNFLLLDVDEPGRELADRLIAQGLIVRTSSDPELARTIRISPATPASNDLLLEALGAATAPAAADPSRVARVQRLTSETQIDCRVAIDGSGQAAVATGIGFLDHMLTALSFHSLIDIGVTCQGDLWVDPHHTVEDVAIGLGQALDLALGDRAGVRRFGDARAPLDEALCHATVDLSGRGMATIDLRLVGPAMGELPTTLVPHFFDTLARQSRIAIHLTGAGQDDHHLCEAAFKSLALALRWACAPDERRGSVPSTKGAL